MNTNTNIIVIAIAIISLFLIFGGLYYYQNQNNTKSTFVYGNVDVTDLPRDITYIQPQGVVPFMGLYKNDRCLSCSGKGCSKCNQTMPETIWDMYNFKS